MTGEADITKMRTKLVCQISVWFINMATQEALYDRVKQSCRLRSRIGLNFAYTKGE